jgi:Snf7
MHNEIQDVLGQSFGIPDEIDEDDLMGELDALEGDLVNEMEAAGGVPSYMQVAYDGRGVVGALRIYYEETISKPGMHKMSMANLMTASHVTGCRRWSCHRPPTQQQQSPFWREQTILGCLRCHSAVNHIVPSGSAATPYG